MRKSRFMIAALAIAAGFSSAAMAEVSGIVKLDGKAPEPQVINMAAQAVCAAAHNAPVKEESIVVSAANGLANVVVAIKKEEGMDLPGDAPKTPVILDQKGCQYSPHVVAMQLGQELHAKNSDATLHNVHSLPEKNDADNVAQPAPGTTKLKTKKDAEYFKVKCDVHPWMNAWVAVIDNPFFAVTDKDGKFTLPKGLPDGEYTLHVWHEMLGEQDVKISVKGDKAADIAISVKAK